MLISISQGASTLVARLQASPPVKDLKSQTLAAIGLLLLTTSKGTFLLNLSALRTCLTRRPIWPSQPIVLVILRLRLYHEKRNLGQGLLNHARTRHHLERVHFVFGH